MHKNVGLLKEEELVLSLNEKRVSELSRNLRYMIKEMYGLIDENSLVKAELIEGFKKPDIKVSINDDAHYISIKSGRSDVVHQENIMKFCMFLRDKGISNRTISTILYFQYGDGTKDGSGKERMSYEELIFRLKDRIKEANEELNKDRDFVWDVILRTTFKGTMDDSPLADYIYHGDVSFGVIASINQVYRHCSRRDWKFYNNLHIGPLHIRPHARYFNKPVKKEESRQKMDFAWINLNADIDYISSRYDG